jgi:hypothetical protein
MGTPGARKNIAANCISIAGTLLLGRVQSAIGISLVTASATWIILIYPALGRMRALSRRISSLMRARDQTGISLAAVNVEGLWSNPALARHPRPDRFDLLSGCLFFSAATRNDHLEA